MMDLTTYNFDEPSMMLDVDKKLLAEARERGFYNGYTPYNKLFSTLFFSGGQVMFKEDIDPEFAHNAFAYLRSFMGSWSPSHQEKEAVCAFILSEIAVVEENDEV